LTEGAPGQPGFELLNQAETLAIGDTYPEFRTMEGTPHVKPSSIPAAKF